MIILVGWSVGRTSDRKNTLASSRPGQKQANINFYGVKKCRSSDDDDEDYDVVSGQQKNGAIFSQDHHGMGE